MEDLGLVKCQRCDQRVESSRDLHICYGGCERWVCQDCIRLRNWSDIHKPEIYCLECTRLEFPEITKNENLELAKRYEELFKLEQAAKIYELYEMWNDALRVRRSALTHKQNDRLCQS